MTAEEFWVFPLGERHGRNAGTGRLHVFTYLLTETYLNSDLTDDESTADNSTNAANDTSRTKRLQLPYKPNRKFERYCINTHP